MNKKIWYECSRPTCEAFYCGDKDSSKCPFCGGSGIPIAPLQSQPVKKLKGVQHAKN